MPKYNESDDQYYSARLRSKGGQTNWENIVTCCKSCNTSKGSKVLDPISEPTKPTFAHLLNGHKLNKQDFPDSAWADYIF